MQVIRQTLPAAAALVVSLHGGLALGQEYPSKPVRIVTAGVGGGGDFASRLIAQGISGPLRQQVIVDNRGGVVSAEVVRQAAPDGYTLLLSSGGLWLAQYLQDNVSYDAMRDFLPVSLVARAPTVLVVHPSIPAKSVKDLIALARSRPGELNFSTGSTGTTGHLAAELFMVMTGTRMVRITYKSTASETSDLLGGQVQLTFGSGGTVMHHIKSGRLRALGVASVEPSPLLPGLPPISASGLTGYEAASLYGVFAPSKTPASVAGRLQQEMARYLATNDAKSTFATVGVEAVGSPPGDFLAVMKADMTKWGKVIKDAGIRAD